MVETARRMRLRMRGSGEGSSEPDGPHNHDQEVNVSDRSDIDGHTSGNNGATGQLSRPIEENVKGQATVEDVTTSQQVPAFLSTAVSVNIPTTSPTTATIATVVAATKKMRSVPRRFRRPPRARRGAAQEPGQSNVASVEGPSRSTLHEGELQRGRAFHK